MMATNNIESRSGYRAAMAMQILRLAFRARAEGVQASERMKNDLHDLNAFHTGYDSNGRIHGLKTQAKKTRVVRVPKSRLIHAFLDKSRMLLAVTPT
jgi:hypothetical protein